MKEKEFEKSTKKQKLAMPQDKNVMRDILVTKILFIPIRQKNDGYGMSACFVFSDDNWVRWLDYDCFRISDYANSSTLIKGDFEHGGVVFFFKDPVTMSYGNDIIINDII